MARPSTAAAVLLWGTAVLFAACEAPEGFSLHSIQQPAASGGTLLFSEYLEGSGDNKAVEIANRGSDPVELGDCRVEVYSNGSGNPTSMIQLDPVELSPRSSLVLCHPAILQPFRCNQFSYSLNHNGNDAILLRCGEEILDSIGRVGEDPGQAWISGEASTRDHTLRRRCDVSAGDSDPSDPFDPALQWNPFPVDSFTDLGFNCRTPLQVGAPDTLELATWNLRNFPTDGSTASRVADLIRTMDLDLVAVQEIASVDRFKKMMGELEGYEGILTDHVYSFTPYYQKTGFVYRRDVVRLLEVESLFENLWYMPRPVLRADLEITRPDGETFNLVLLNAHLKSGVSPDERDKRKRACRKIKSYVDALLADDPQTRVVILGDLNDELDDQPEYNVFGDFLGDPEDYRFETAALLDQEGEYSLLTSKRLVDHILTTASLDDTLISSSTLAVPLDWDIATYDYEDKVSDHRPVVTVFPF